MGFRDELEAARARIGALEADLAELRRKAPGDRGEVSPFAVTTVLVLLVAVGLGVALAFEWRHAEQAEATAREWRRLEGEASQELHAARVQLAEERARRLETLGPARACEDAEEGDALGPNEWGGFVTERIGSAPARLVDACDVIVSRRDHPDGVHCALVVRCGERTVFPGEGEAGEVACRGPEIRPRDASAAPRVRVSGRAGALHLDDGPDGTWSLRIEGRAE
jgi:hypothetical protein